MDTFKTDWDDIVIGSGIGGLACAAALAKTGHRALVLERHWVAGGLTQTFRRDSFVWDVGMHYLTEAGPNGFVRAICDWITGGALKFVSTGAVYDTLHFPGGFEFQFSSPEAALKHALKERFPSSSSEIDAAFGAFSAAYIAGKALGASRAMPQMLARLYEWRHRKKICKWWGRSLAEVLDELVSDAKLRAVLAAVWGDHGGLPKDASFGIHSMALRGYYMEGAYYPVGGATAFAEEFIRVIERAGGAVKLRSPVARILIENGVAAGVELDDGTRFRARRVFSDAGALNTVGRLLPVELRESSLGKGNPFLQTLGLPYRSLSRTRRRYEGQRRKHVQSLVQ